MDMQLILLPTDGSPSARKALEFAADLAGIKKARLLILHVQQRHGSDVMPEELEELERVEHLRVTEREIFSGAAKQVAEDAEAATRSLGVGAVESLVVEGDPARRIVEVAEERKVDAIVMGTRGLGDLQGLLVGSVSHKVSHLAPCSCVLVR